MKSPKQNASAPANGAHTPGPWLVRRNRKANGRFEVVAAACPSFPIACPGGRSGFHETKANSHLISAAPDLLAAADKLLTDWAAGRNLSESAQMLSRAQAKAEGRA